VNPTAGGGRAGKLLPALQKFAKRIGWQVEYGMAQSPAEFACLAQSAAAAGRARIFMLGGDGTVQVLLNAVAGFPDVALGILPAGGGNDLASALGLPGDPVRAAELLLDGETCFLDAARVRTADGIQRLYLGGGGVGLDAEAARFASGVYKNLPGRGRYLFSAIRALWRFQPLTIRATSLSCEAHTLQADVLLLAILNTPSYGAGLRLAPEARTNDGKLDMVLLEDLPFLKILTLLPALAIRGTLHTKRLRHYHVDQIRIETQRPCLFHADGEILGWTPVEVAVIPQAIRMLCPRKPSQSL
jgi:diacylglycerol kinase (ATP)